MSDESDKEPILEPELPVDTTPAQEETNTATEQETAPTEQVGVFIFMEEDTDKQNNNRPWLWKKGQSGNLLGRPKGKTLKEYAREYLSKMNDDERDEWLDGLNKDLVWRMAEGTPDTKTDITSGGKPIPLFNYAENRNHNGNQQDTEPNQENPDSSGGNISEQDNINPPLPNQPSTS